MNVMTDTVIDASWLEPVDVAPDEAQNLAKKGDLFFNGSSETPEEVGFCSVLLEAIPNLYLNSFCFGFRFNAAAKVNGLFFAYWFRSKAGRAAMSVLAQGATRYNIAKSAFMKLEIPQPLEEEQTAIATVLSDMGAELAALETSRNKAHQLKQGMMQELLTGRVRLVEQSLSFDTISPRFLCGILSAPVFSSLLKCEINKLLESGGSAEKIMTEVESIERAVNISKTKAEDMFKHEPLKGLWKKHYFTAEFLTKNLENSWSSAAANKKLTTAIANTLATNPDNPETVASEVAQLVVGDTYRDKADASRLTGEWIVYGEKDGIRHYLGLAKHDEGDEVIYARLVAGCGQELIDSLKCASGMQ